MINRDSFNKYFYSSLWIGWVIFILFISYQTRFWINNDSIGSLDSARFFRSLHFKEAFNAYWGIGFALILSALPLKNINSWLQIHLLIGLMVLVSQIFIYKSLSYLDIRKSLITSLCIIWGAANYATGGAFFVSADVPLCFFASIYLFVAFKAETSGKITTPGYAGLLGSLHGLAWMTKTVALPSLMIFPVLIVLRNLINSNNTQVFKTKLINSAKFSLFYLMPLFFMITLWGYGTYSKYGRFTLSESATYTHALYVDKSNQLNEAKRKARHELPSYGTYFWSDIGLSLSDWDHKINYHATDQINRIISNINYFLTSREMINGLTVIALSIFSIFSLIILYLRKTKDLSFLLITTIIAFTIFAIYSTVLLLARYLPYGTIFLIPVVGSALEQLLRGKREVIRKIIFISLIMALLHGILSMLYVSLFMAPGGEDFAIVKDIRAHNKSQEFYGPIGAYLGPYDYLYHHAVIAYLLNTQAAEISRVGEDISRYKATFSPATVLLALSPTDNGPINITVNNKKYNQVKSYVWGRSFKKTKLVIYE